MSMNLTPARWKQVSDICIEVVSCPPNERQSLIDKLTKGDESLKKDVLHWLKSFEESGSLNLTDDVQQGIAGIANEILNQRAAQLPTDDNANQKSLIDNAQMPVVDPLIGR